MNTSDNGGGNVPEVSRSDVAPFRSKADNLSIDDIMWRVRVAVAQRSGQTGTAVPTNLADIPSYEEFLPKWKSVVPRLPRKDEYALAELLAYSGPDFIDVAYSAILHRSPDENGFNHYFNLLRNGAATKVEILWTLCSSQEGQAAGVRIVGLRLPYALHHWRRKRFLGPIVAWVDAFLRLGTLADCLSASEASQAREIQETGRTLNLAAECLAQRIASLKLQLAARPTVAEFETLKNEYAAVVQRLTELEHLAHTKFRRQEEER